MQAGWPSCSKPWPGWRPSAVGTDVPLPSWAARNKCTVETHVTNILNKLGLHSRVQLTRWLAESAPAVANSPRQA